MRSYNPGAVFRTGLGSSLFARHYLGNHCYFLFLRLLRCFSSPGWLSLEWYTFSIPGCPIRKPTDHRLYAATRSLSQLTTSFIAYQCQGIHHAPLFALNIVINYYHYFPSPSSASQPNPATEYFNCFPIMSKNFAPHALKTSALAVPAESNH